MPRRHVQSQKMPVFTHLHTVLAGECLVIVGLLRVHLEIQIAFENFVTLVTHDLLVFMQFHMIP